MTVLDGATGGKRKRVRRAVVQRCEGRYATRNSVALWLGLAITPGSQSGEWPERACAQRGVTQPDPANLVSDNLRLAPAGHATRE